MATKITPRAKDPNETARFVAAIYIALDTFEDEIGSLHHTTKSKAYENFICAYKTALIEVWDLAQSADVTLILAVVKDPEMRELTTMARKLQVPKAKTRTEVEHREVSSLETITEAMVSTYPRQALPSTAICKTIGTVFSKLNEAHKSYAEAAEVLAQLSTQLSPEHYKLLLTAATAPAIQLVIPPGVISPVAAPPPPPHHSTTPMGRETIIDATKLKVLPDPDAPCFMECNKNSATCVLATAIYLKLEHKFFDNTHSRMEVSTAFRCNVSQLSKALTMVEYHSGPHHYKPKSRESRKRSTEQGEPSDAP